MKPGCLRASRPLAAGAVLVVAAVIGLLWNADRVGAYSNYLSAAESQYPNIVGKALDSCNLCHPSGGYTLNSYGSAYKASGHVFKTIESADSDRDGYSNIAEITALTFPGNAASHPNGSPAATPTRTAVPPTATRTGATAAPTRTATAPAATPTRTSTAPPPPVATASGPTPTPFPLAGRAMFAGQVSALPQTSNHSGDWSVSRRTVHVAAWSWIEHPELLGLQSQVWVLGSRRTDGSVDALYVRTLSGGSSLGQSPAP